jgi:N-methylhydantoinase A
MHSGGGTLTVSQASDQAARLVLSGPAGGVIGASYVAAIESLPSVITYDMGGTSTDVATILDGAPRRTTWSVVDGLPIGLPMFDIHTIGAGGGSIAQLDTGGALRVGPQSAGAVPGPACYGRGGTLPTVTDANVVLGRIPTDALLGGSVKLDADAARRAIAPLAQAMSKSIIEAALGMITVAEANMAHAVRAVTSRRGLDPRDFALVSFGGAGGLHACAIAEQLDIRRVLVPPFCGVLSALGMVVAPPVVDVSRTVLHLRDRLDDDRIAAEYGALSARTIEQIPYEQTSSVEATVDVRFKGQSHELNVRVGGPGIENIRQAFLADYRREYGNIPTGRDIEIVTLRLRRTGRRTEIALPDNAAHPSRQIPQQLIDVNGRTLNSRALNRAALRDPHIGPILVLDPEATTFVPAGWTAQATSNGSILLEKLSVERQ